MQHPARASRRSALRDRFAAHTLRHIVRSWPLRTRSRSSSATLRLPLVEEPESAKLFPKSQSAREVRDKLLALRVAKG